MNIHKLILASPKSMEYIAKVMPQDQSAMYQGYLYLASAFGFLVGRVAYSEANIEMSNH